MLFWPSWKSDKLAWAGEIGFMGNTYTETTLKYCAKPLVASTENTPVHIVRLAVCNYLSIRVLPRLQQLLISRGEVPGRQVYGRWLPLGAGQVHCVVEKYDCGLERVGGNMKKIVWLLIHVFSVVRGTFWSHFGRKGQA